MSHHRLRDHEDEIFRYYFEEGQSLQYIGDQFGKSREAVRQYLNSRFPDRPPGVEFRHIIREADKALQEKLELEKRRETAQACVICGDPVIRRTGGTGKNRTCSTEHSRLWTKARFILDPELKKAQRLSMAKSVLKNKEKHNRGTITWATRVMNGDVPTWTQGTIHKDSKAQQAYTEVMRIRTEKGYHP